MYSEKTVNITVIILTYNEEQHIERCLKSVSTIADDVYVVDSFSTDQTVTIAEKYGVNVLRNRWVNHAAQFNWALGKLSGKRNWILRIDADEYLTSELIMEIQEKLPNMGMQIDGVYCNRMIKFQGKLIRHGGVYAVPVLRLFRYGKGMCEMRWMDEHIMVAGSTAMFNGGIVDDNLNTLTWWIEKHNQYASREAVDLLNLEYHFQPLDSVASLSDEHVELKRWIKENVYCYLPGGLRAFLYFIYRYFFHLGFLDGKIGLTFHFLQAFWYRYLVDAKQAEVRRYIKANNVDINTACEAVLELSL